MLFNIINLSFVFSLATMKPEDMRELASDWKSGLRLLVQVYIALAILISLIWVVMS